MHNPKLNISPLARCIHWHRTWGLVIRCFLLKFTHLQPN